MHSPSPSPSSAFASLSSALPANQSTNLVTHSASSSAGPFLVGDSECFLSTKVLGAVTPTVRGRPQGHPRDRITCMKSNNLDCSLPQPSQEILQSLKVVQQISAQDNVAQLDNVFTTQIIDNSDFFPIGAGVQLPVYDNFASSPNYSTWNPFQPTQPRNDSLLIENDIQQSIDNVNMTATPLYAATPGTPLPFPILQGPVAPKTRTPCQYCMETFTRVPDLARHIQSVHMGIKHHCTYPGCPNNRGKGYCRLEKLRTHQKEKHGFTLV